MIVRPRPPQKDLLAHWFDKYHFNIENGIVLSPIGDSSRLPQAGRSFLFDKVDDYITVTGINADIKTVSVVLKPNSITVNNYIIKFNATQSIRVINDTVELVGFTGNIYVNNVSGSVITNGWEHIIVTTTDSVSVIDLEIGRTSEGYYGGYMYDLQIYDDVKTNNFISYE